MAKEKRRVPAFDEIVFEIRNKEYGAYAIRKKYSRTVIVAILIGIIILSTAVITPYLNAKALGNKQQREEKQVEIVMENLDQPTEQVAPPPAAPPPPTDVVQANKYVPPEVVDSIRPEDMVQMITADEALVEIQDEEVGLEVVEIVQEEIQEEEEAEPEPFIIVEEMPQFPGGEPALLAYISDHIIYPEIAKENNIQGRVTVSFCVTSQGGVDLVTILRGVDPELDAEAMRVVRELPAFKPGKQGGKPVPVWYRVPIIFRLN